MTDTRHMTDEEYLTFLYDRAAQRYGYASHAAYRAELDAAMGERLAKMRAQERAAMEAWAKAQLSAD